jgi:transcription elongation factor SPT6
VICLTFIIETDEETLRKEIGDLINDEEEEDDDGSEEEEVHSKRRRDEDEDQDLEDDDYALLEENLGVRVERKKKFKRVKRFEDDSDNEQEHGPEDEREAIANELFDGKSSHFALASRSK